MLLPSVLWRCWLSGRKGIRWVAGVVVCLERDADLHMGQRMPLPLNVSCFSKIQIGFTILVPAHLGSPRQRAVCVVVSVPLVTWKLFSSNYNQKWCCLMKMSDTQNSKCLNLELTVTQCLWKCYQQVDRVCLPVSSYSNWPAFTRYNQISMQNCNFLIQPSI